MNDTVGKNLITLPNLEFVLNKAKIGHQEALAEIYNFYFQPIYRFVFYRVSHREVAEDITEEVFIKAFSSLKSLEKSGAFEGWLYKIARNKVIDYYRSKKQLASLDEVENTLEYETNIVDIANMKTEQALLIKLMRQMPSDYQQIIKLKFFEDLDNQAIAQIMQKREGSIRVLQFRAIAKLKSLFAEHLTTLNKLS